MQPLLEVIGLSAGYGKAQVLRRVSMRADVGGVVTVIGPNGAGKSTLLNALMGLLPLSEGQVRLAGEDISRLSLEERVMAGMALVPEKRELFGAMSVEDNLLLGGWRLRRMKKAGGRDGLERAYALFPRLKERRQQTAGTMSGGERQMLALGRALMSDPKLLMLDEPSLGLAPLVVQNIFRAIEHLQRSGATVLLVEQNARAALRLAQYGYVLEMGKVRQEGPAHDLQSDPSVIGTYLGRGAAAGHSEEKRVR